MAYTFFIELRRVMLIEVNVVLIKSIELKGFKRLLLGNIDHIKIMPASKLQLIIGTNGCGKSSLLSELSPLPSSPVDFNKGGFKRIEIEHRGDLYILESRFSSAGHHCLLKNGEELNPGHTAAVQKELVLQIFGWSQPLHDLITGVTRFTAMTPSKRREWLLQLSTVSYDYALMVYNLLMMRLRDSKGVIKHLHQRVSQEQQQLKQIETDEDLAPRAEKLKEELNLLLLSSVTGTPLPSAVESELRSILQELKTDSDKIFSIDLKDIDFSEPLDQLADTLNRQIQSEEVVLKHATSEIAQLEQNSPIVDTASLPEDIQLQIDQLETKIQTLLQKKDPQYTIESADIALEQSKDIADQWHTIFNHLPDNSERQFTIEAHKRAVQEREVSQRAIDHSSAKLSSIHHRRTVLKSIEPTQCPQCQYQWRIGYDQAEFDKLDRWEDEHQALIQSYQKKITQADRFLESYNETQQLYNQLKGLMNSMPLLKPLWDDVIENKRHIEAPSRSVGLIKHWINQCTIQTEIDRAQEQLNDLRILKEQDEKGLVSYFQKRFADLTLQIETSTSALKTLKETYRDTTKKIERIRRLESLGQNLKKTLDKYRSTLSSLYASIAQDRISACLAEKQKELANISANISQIQTLKSILKDLLSSQAQAEQEYQIFQELTDILSPTTGLIAEEISGFMSCIVEQLNAAISSIWTYDLEVLPCTMETTGDLNYKFPLSNGQNLIPDIERGSQAQRDVIDFAFVLMVLMYKNMENVPLFLDELGASFDEQHRINLMGFIKQLVDSHRFSQVFMISHYASTYASMNSADIIVLDATNVAVPNHHNQHVSFQ